MHERRFHRDKDTLRSPERIARLEVDRVVELSLQDIKPQNVLDIGTGTGLFAERFARQGLRIAGVDANPEMIKAVQDYLPDGEFLKGIAEVLPFPDQSFDLVFMGVLLHETDDALQALREARRVARIRLSILEWPYRQEESGPPLEHRLQPKTVESLAAEAGFRNFDMITLTHTVLYRMSV